MKSMGVVINVGTDLVATLALTSLATHAPDLPTRLINCAPSTASREHFQRLSHDLGFEVVEAPVRRHWEVLEELFTETDADVLLLLDSDAEIRNPEIVTRCLTYLENPAVFGSGFFTPGQWLGAREGAAAGVGYFQERMWVPFTALRVSHIREGLAAGRTFRNYTFFNDVPAFQKFSHRLAHRIDDGFAGSPGKYHRWLPHPQRLGWLRRDFNGQRPNYVVFDTGADIYQWCKYDREWIFAGVDDRVQSDVAHYQGVTRNQLGDGQNAQELTAIDVEVRERLASYGR